MKMNLKKYLDEGRICPHVTSQEEIRHLFEVIRRDLADASIAAISADRRHATAYNAVLQLATVTLYASGYRAKSKTGHHWATLTLIPEIMGKDCMTMARYFNACREKRNLTDYDTAGHITKEEAIELIKEAEKFKELVLKWLKKSSPNLISKNFG